MDWLMTSLGDLFNLLAIEIEHVLSPEWWSTHTVPLFNILMIDLTLAGDNAIVVGMAASRVPKEMRSSPALSSCASCFPPSPSRCCRSSA